MKTATEHINEQLKSISPTQSWARLRKYMDSSTKTNNATLKAVRQIQGTLPSHLERTMIEEPFYLEDAIGRVSPVHLQFIASWDALDHVLETRFRNLQGHHKIQREDFVFQERTTRRDISRATPWEGSILPGQKVDMSIVFSSSHDPYQMYCPACAAGWHDGTWVLSWKGILGVIM